MAVSYFVNLRQKIVLTLKAGATSQRDVADLCHLSSSFVETLLRQPRAGGRWLWLGDPVRQQLSTWLAEQPDLTLVVVSCKSSSWVEKRRATQRDAAQVSQARGAYLDDMSIYAASIVKKSGSARM